MNFIYTIFIALPNNFDNISVRIAYSIPGIKISILKNLWISIITFFISSFSAFWGTISSEFLSKHTSSMLSMVLLITIGFWIIIEPYIKKESNDQVQTNDSKETNILNILKKQETADIDNSKDIDFKEATLLGIALSINNIGGGLSAGIIGLNSFFVGFFSAIISFLALLAGNYMTDFFDKFNMGKKSTTLAGIILIIIGVKQII